MVSFDAVVFCLSQQNLNARREEALAQAITRACALPSAIVRLEGTGPNLGSVLDKLACEGRRRILVQPLGLPFPPGLAAWLPGVLAHWMAQRPSNGVALFMGSETISDVGITAIVEAAILGRDVIDIADRKPSLGKPGWNAPPPFKHHILVCTGPRCHFHGAPNLKLALDAALTEAGVKTDCLIATTGCLYPCNKGPMLALYPRGEWFRLPDGDAVRRFVETVIVAGDEAPDLVIHRVPSQS